METDSEHAKVYNASDKFLDLEPTPTETGLNKSCLPNKILIPVCLPALISLHDHRFLRKKPEF